MSNFTRSGSGASIWQSITNLSCCSIDLITRHTKSIKAFAFVMLFMFSMSPMLAQTAERSTFFNRCQEDAPSGPSEADVANMYLNQCGSTPAEVVKTASMSGNDCDWEVEYTYDVKCGTFEEQIKIGYVGGDRTAPTLNDGAQVPGGSENLNLCFNQAPSGPTIQTIAALFSDDCGDVIVTKSGQPSGDDCSWTANYTYQIQDSCGNFADDININYSGGDNEPPMLAKGVQIPGDQENLNICFDDKPQGPTEGEIAELFEDNCGNITVTKTSLSKGDQCKWMAVYEYTVRDDCFNFSKPIRIEYSGGDQSAPVLAGVPADAEYSCIDEVPNPPKVTATDNCFEDLDVQYSQNTDNLGLACEGGTIVRTWIATDDCGNSVTETQNIVVSPAPAAEFEDVSPEEISCEAAFAFEASNLSYSNGISEGACSIEGSVPGTVTPNFTVCGGTITVNWTFSDECGRTINAEKVYTVTPAPPATLDDLQDFTLSCDAAAAYVAEPLNYSNGLEGDCSLDGSIDPVQDNQFDACGGQIVVTYNGEDACGNPLSATLNITVLPAPEAVVTAPEFSSKIACADAAAFEAANATYTNGLTGLCEISGELEALVVKEYTACGGLITISYTGQDQCENPLSAGPFYIEVDPAPVADVTTPEFPANIVCADADGFTAADATFSNGLEGTACEISGSITANVTKEYNSCGGTITITYTGKDLCERDLAAGPFVIDVDPAPEATITTPEFPSDIMCVDAGVFEAANATYSNGLTDLCEISGSLEANIVNDYDLCGGKITVSYSGEDACGRPLNAGPFEINVMPAPEASFAPVENEEITCAQAENYIPSSLEYSNGLDGECGINGSVEGVLSGEFTACGGLLFVDWTYTDDCQRTITVRKQLKVDPAPSPTLEEVENFTLSCDAADSYQAGSLAYSNGLEGVCNISGALEPVQTNNFDECGGTITVTWDGEDVCGTPLSASQTITVEPAPQAEFINPLPNIEVTCDLADDYIVTNLAYSNGLEGTCGINGEVPGALSGSYDACGGTLFVDWTFTDECGRTIDYRKTITVLPAPPAVVTAPEFPSKVACADAAGFEAANATYSNGLTQACEISGEIEALVVKEYTECGGSITISYTGEDSCGNPLSAGPFVIEVDPAPEADVTTPEFPANIDCADADGFTAADATFSNGLEGTACEISGSIEANVVKEYNACGGTITISYTSKDSCERDLVAGPFVIDVNPAPEADVTTPEFPADIICADAAAFEAANATYTNGLTGLCEISGELEANVVKTYDACGGTITISYEGFDACQNPLSAGPFVIDVLPAPAADVTTPEFPANIVCADAAAFEAANATYSNGLEGTACEISGEIIATVNKDYTACGGTITISYSGKDACERDLSAGPFVITVDPAPEAEVFVPQFPIDVECVDAEGFTAPDATYSNGLEETACDISGSIMANVVKDYDACGGTITVSYLSEDLCGRELAAGPFVIEVKPAPAPVFDPIADDSIACEDLDSYVPVFLGYSNSIDGPCGINGEVQGVAEPFEGSCGTFEVNFSYESCGVTITASQTITVIDETAPTLNEPGSLPQGLSDVNACLADAPAPPTEEEIEALYSDNCGNVNATLTIISPQENTDCLWAILYRYEIQDDCGNFAAPVKIYYNGGDATPPELTGELPMGVEGLQCLSENPGAPDLAVIQAAYTDNCGEVIVNPLGEVISGDDCGWTATYEYEIEDTCGNKLPNLVIVNSGADTEAPVLEGEIPMGANMLNLCIDADLGEPTEEEIAALFFDNCTEITADNVVKIEKITIGSDCEWIRVFEYTVSDDCGNAYPVFKVNYQGADTEAPVMNPECSEPPMVFTTEMGADCPADAVIDLVAGDFITPEGLFTVAGINLTDMQGMLPLCFSDNCTAVEDLRYKVVTVDKDLTNSCSAILTLEFSAIDLCDNESDDLMTCVFIINDTTAPVIVCPADVELTESAASEGSISGTNTTGGPIPEIGDIGPASFTANVAGIPAGAAITDITVDMNISHTWTGDLEITLVSPSGAEAILLLPDNTQADGSSATDLVNTNITFDDSAATAVTDDLTASGGTWKPNDGSVTFADFIATLAGDQNGDWELSIIDDAGGDSGSLQSWSVNIGYEVAGETADTDPSATGEATATDNCSVPTVTFNDSSEIDGCGVETITRTWTAVDACNLESSCVQTITIDRGDSTAPVITCPADAELSAANGGTATGEYGPTADPFTPIPDNDSGGLVVVANVADVPAGETITDITATIDLNHSWVGDLIFTLTAPSGESIVLLDRAGADGAGFGDSSNASVDGTLTFTDAATVAAEDMGAGLDSGQTVCVDDGICDYLPHSGTFADYIASLVGADLNGDWTMSISDNASGDTGAVRGFSVNVSYGENLDISPEALGFATATDSCDPEPVVASTDEEVVDETTGDTIITRTWTATDAAGNAASCEQIISIINPCTDEAPVLECPDDQDFGLVTETPTAFAESVPFTDNDGDGIATDFTDSEITVTQGVTSINGFVGAYAPETWNLSGTGASDFASASIGSDTIQITGPDNGSDAPGSVSYTNVCSASGEFSFDWAYSSTDDPGFDAGFYVNGVLVQNLSATSGESGSLTVNCVAGDVIGFGVSSFDNLFGPGVLTITNFVGATVPSDMYEFTRTFTATDDCGNEGTCDVIYSWAIEAEPCDLNTIQEVFCGDVIAGNTADGGPEDVLGGTFISTGNWYSFVGTGEAIAIFSTCNNASFDTIIEVWTDCGETLVTGNDDASGCGLTSIVDLFAAAGVEYNIFVRGFNGGTGTYGLEVSCDPVQVRQMLTDQENVNEDVKIDFKAFPVPFDHEVTISYSFDFKTNVTIEFFDTKGLLVLSETNDRYVTGSTGRSKVDLSRLSNQMFYVKLTTSQGTVTKKIVSSGM